jgi:hypothetical protein
VNVRSFLQLVLTQGTILRRNTGFWVTSIMTAVLSMAVFGWLFNPDTQPFDLALVDEDRSQASRTLVEAFEGIDNVETRQGSRESEMASLEDGDLGAVVIVPEGFADDLGSGSAALPVFYDNRTRCMATSTTVNAVVNCYNKRVMGQSGAVTVQQQPVSARTCLHRLPRPASGDDW